MVNDVKIYGQIGSYGHVSIYDERRFVQSLNATQLATLYREAMKEREDEFDQMCRLSSVYYSRTKAGVAVEWIHAMSSFYSRAIQKRHYQQMIEQKCGFIEAYCDAVDTFLSKNDHSIKNGSMLGDPTVLEAFHLLYQRSIHRFELFLFNRWISTLNHDCIVWAKRFHKAYFYQLSPHVLGFIFKSDNHPGIIKTYAKRYHLPIAVTHHLIEEGDCVSIDAQNQLLILDQHSTHETNKIYLFSAENQMQAPYRLYAQTVDNRHRQLIAQTPWISGVCVYKTECLYHSKGTIPSVHEFKRIFINMFHDLKNKEIFIALPDINPDFSIEGINNHFTDLDLYNQNPAIFENLLSGIAQASLETKTIPKIVVPMIRMYHEVAIWTTIIESIFENENSVIPDIGILMETESALEYHEDFTGLKFAIIGIDNLIEELSDFPSTDKNITFQDLKSLLWNDLKNMHQFFRSYAQSTRHIIMGEALSDPIIFDKLIKAGFREFALPLHALPHVEPIVCKHLQTRGKYKGVHASRKQENNQNLAIFRDQ